jgi:hypothetical protein
VKPLGWLRGLSDPLIDRLVERVADRVIKRLSTPTEGYDIGDQIATYLSGCACPPQVEIERAVGGRAAGVRAVLRVDLRFTRVEGCRSTPRHRSNATCWALASKALQASGTRWDEMSERA